MRIIIAEDSIPFREELKEILQEIPQTKIVAETENELETVEQVTEHQPNILILDIQLKSGTGVNVLKALRKDMKLPESTIVLTNYSDEQYKSVCLKEGATFFYDKTLEIQEAIQCIEELIKNNNKAKENKIEIQ